VSIQFDETVLNAMVEFEGLSFEEAKLSYAKREKLPSSAFCGPHRTYPAHDAAHVRNALSRLGTFGRRLKAGVRARILSCLKKRAKRFGVEIGETVEGRYCIAKWDETVPQEERNKMLIKIQETVEWFTDKNKKEKN